MVTGSVSASGSCTRKSCHSPGPPPPPPPPPQVVWPAAPPPPPAPPPIKNASTHWPRSSGGIGHDWFDAVITMR
ncbi:hypothetical protein C0J07_12860 [Bordetella avium]|nr:hypothetical protein C0J07_12860 [Bordetella avium]